MEQQALTEKIINLGVSKVGYSDVEDVLPKKFKHLKSAISIAVRLSDQIISDIDIEKGPTHTYFHHYRTANTFIDQTTFKITTWLQETGFLAMAIPASQSINAEGWNYQALFSHRMAATKSGIGWIGKNCCLVTDEYGPRIRLGTVLTNMEFVYNSPILSSKCANCEACVKSCPANALTGAIWTPQTSREQILDPDLCSTHMKKHYKNIGRGAVCGICVKVCPKGNKAFSRK